MTNRFMLQIEIDKGIMCDMIDVAYALEKVARTLRKYDPDITKGPIYDRNSKNIVGSFCLEEDFIK